MSSIHDVSSGDRKANYSSGDGDSDGTDDDDDGTNGCAGGGKESRRVCTQNAAAYGYHAGQVGTVRRWVRTRRDVTGPRAQSCGGGGGDVTGIGRKRYIQNIYASIYVLYYRCYYTTDGRKTKRAARGLG